MIEVPAEERVDAADLRDAWPVLSRADRLDGFQRLSREEADDFFLALGTQDQADLLLGMPQKERRLWVRLLAPDDMADLLQVVPAEERTGLLGLLDEAARREVTALCAYAEDAAGGLMNPRFSRVRAEATVDEALRYLRKQAQDRFQMTNYAYVLDAQQKLIGVCSLRELFAAPGDLHIGDVMQRDVVSVDEGLDQEDVAQVLAEHDLIAIPVVDAEGVMRGVVSADDVVDVVQEEATEDIQKLGGMEALENAYLRTPFWELAQKRGGWLTLLFVGEMLTATAMARYEVDIEKAVVLAVFIPLIISSGGNSGSQATTLVIRAIALGEVRLRDWWRVARRELSMGLALGALLAVLGALRVAGAQLLFNTYDQHAIGIGITVAVSVVGVVTWGTLVGSMLPFVLKRFGLDPASASAPLVATLVDVLGLVIYFSIAQVVLKGTLL